MKTDLSIMCVRFENFRNYATLELTNLSRLVIIVGDNALGKTNIIEGIQLVSMVDSFRKPPWNDVVRKESDHAHVAIEFQLKGCKNHLYLDVRENKRFYQLNEKAKSVRDLFGLLPAVLFTPNDLQIIQGPAERRRLGIDDFGCQLSRSFVDIRQDYTRVIKQKNALLREEKVDFDTLASWNRNLVKLGSSLMAHRSALFERVMEKASVVYHHIAPAEQLTAAYMPSWLLISDPEGNFSDSSDDKEYKGFGASAAGGKEEGREEVGGREAGKEEADRGEAKGEGAKEGEIGEREAQRGETKREESKRVGQKERLAEMLTAMLERHQAQEIRQGRSLVGPHRDEIIFFINGNDVRRFGSQGQQRSVALALKIAEVEILRELIGADPILLLDDVMSEIDEGRRKMLLDLIDTTTQTFITTTNLGYFDDKTLQQAQIIRLPLQENMQETPRAQIEQATQPMSQPEIDSPQTTQATSQPEQTTQP